MEYKWVLIGGIRHGDIIRNAKGENKGRKKYVTYEHEYSKRRVEIMCSEKEPKATKQIFMRHRDSKTRLYRIWMGMKQRCLNPKNNYYYNYGGRGITFSDEWLDYEVFRYDMEPTHDVTKTLDRINNNAGYSKTNCRWATKFEQARNMRHNVLIEINGQIKCLAEWCEINGIKQNTAVGRITRQNWCPIKAVTFVPKELSESQIMQYNKKKLVSNGKKT